MGSKKLKNNFKNKIILITVFAFIGFSVSAQNEVPDQPFVKLKNGELHKGSLFEMDKKWFKASTVYLDSTSFKLKEVTFYRGNDNDLYGRIGRNLYKCIHNANNMYIYKIVSTGTSAPTSYNPGSPATGANFRAGTPTISVKYYFNRGLNKIKKVNVNNLLNEMEDNKEAHRLIWLAHQKQNYSKIALGVFVAGAAISILPLENKYPSAKLIPFISVGGLVTCLVFNNQKWKTTYKALKVYTGFDA